MPGSLGCRETAAKGRERSRNENQPCGAGFTTASSEPDICPGRFTQVRQTSKHASAGATLGEAVALAARVGRAPDSELSQRLAEVRELLEPAE